MKHSRTWVTIAGLWIAASCGSSQQQPPAEPEGPAERAGDKIDEAAENATDAIQDAGQRVQEKGEEVKEDIQGRPDAN